MFYKWFSWQFELIKIDTTPPISQWKVSESTIICFVESYVIIIKENK